VRSDYLPMRSENPQLFRACLRIPTGLVAAEVTRRTAHFGQEIRLVTSTATISNTRLEIVEFSILVPNEES